jgi:VWFA-related protein
MRARLFLKLICLGLGLCLAAAIAVHAFPQSSAPTPSSSSSAPHAAQPAQSGTVLKVTTRLVTLDLIARDSHGKPVRDLKAEELQVLEEKKVPQKIEQFEFVESPNLTLPPGNAAIANRDEVKTYSNQVASDQLRISPTILLMDGVNTQTTNQMQGRPQMLRLLKTLPPNTPVAVFLMGGSLKVIQGFTSDGALLHSAVDHALAGTDIEQDPRDDPNALSASILDLAADTDTNISTDIQDFEKEQYAGTIDIRVRKTLDALTTIAQFLSGIRGRKNLIWVSESFPVSLEPDADTGTNAFAGVRSYGDQVALVANDLTDAQVSVYPVDIRGLQTQQSFTASQPTRRGLTGPMVAAQLNRESNARFQTQATMDMLAEGTGGRTCKNTNDLSGCIATALNDSSSYYELSFYPQDIPWDGKFHKISVKTTRPGVKLSYRAGYYAFDAEAIAKTLAPEDHLRKACNDLLPSTAIPLAAQAVPRGGLSASLQPGLHYVLLISPAGLGSTQGGNAHLMNLREAACEFTEKGDSFRMTGTDLTRTVSDDVYRSWQSTGIPDQISIIPAANTRRIRFVILDVPTGLAGAIDIPVQASEIAQASAPGQLPPLATTPFLEIPDKEKPPAQPKPMKSMNFHLASSGQSGALDWDGDVLLYKGDLPVDKAASGFSSFAFGDRFRCVSGRFVSVDSAGNEAGPDPVLKFAFHNHDGKIVIVDLNGQQPEYQGDLVVDPSARSLFDLVWKSSHCQSQ